MKKKKKSTKGERKKERQRSPSFTRKAQKCHKRLMYKTKGVEPNPRVEGNKITSKMLLRFLLNITLKHSLSL